LEKPTTVNHNHYMSVSLKTLFVAGVLVFVSPNLVFSQANADVIRTAVESSNWPVAFVELNNLRQTDPTSFQSGGYDYLLGRVAEKTNDLPVALANYQSAVDHNSVLSAYALWHLAHISRSTGDLVSEREYLRRLISTSPQSLLFDSASLRLGESFIESGDYPSAVASLRAVSTSKNVSLAREASVLIGQSLLRDGKTTEAYDTFNKLIMTMPNAARPDDYALTATRELDGLDKATPQQSRTPLSEADELLRASIYQFNRDFSAARRHYQLVVDKFPQSGTVASALYQIGRGLYSEGEYEDAIKYFRKVIDEFPQATTARDAMGYLASSYVRLKQTDAAVATYKLLIQQFPDAPDPERPYLNIIDALHEAGRYAEALNWVQQTRSKFKTELGGTLALFSQLRIHLAQGTWQAVISDADELLKSADLGGARTPGGTTSAEVSFLGAYSLEKLGHIDDAVTGYLGIVDGRNEYYGARATQRLRALATDPNYGAAIKNRLVSLIASAKAAAAKGDNDGARIAAQAALRLTSDPTVRAELERITKTSYESLPAYQFVNLKLLRPTELVQVEQSGRTPSPATILASLGLYDEAIPELFAANPTSPPTQNNVNNSDRPYSIAIYSLRGGLANRAVRFAEQLWKNMPADYVIEAAPRDLAELLYPAPHRESLLNHATRRNLDPRFVLSIARQESRYQADAKSVAAARGMMQFIPATANEIAAQLKLQNFSQDDLYDADTAILFGSQYLANLFRQFPSQPDAVAAAYNAGADNMNRWKARARSEDPERYVPEIGFAQTKDYVYRVMANFWNYQRLYDAQFKPITSTSAK
jgi:soluble lytic murein transglycosylase